MSPEDYNVKKVLMFLKFNSNFSYQYLNECIYCLTSVGVTIMTSTLSYSFLFYTRALGLPTKLAPYRSDTVYLAMIATTLSQYEYVLICDKSNIRVSGSPQIQFNRLLTMVDNIDRTHHVLNAGVGTKPRMNRYPATLLPCSVPATLSQSLPRWAINDE
ncbi:hypothetical protein PHYBLDRAFT_171074 [Phycomyces blakesleeanus NRRL 1555(-)]|uniref:Uncharacterized protein n=1 Tax=Phycomyces blakesleeanus (strain ATCC 8743b / DSM 1359 / FGSC 10004 / NBRC 33097 / NRRL 1555) TaxID=763407 RepID=A0A162TZ64_PHYB8|nr:hypothetical protein PHYBLDRAFT_171074 [Phycomyces blakesleeanus NRRL 1555(-)]OAD71013.1 hypothetical protein PHYBLDRAFT_171074 [Phycomyces blakesleeanus NRRL 1555(-)]|eukprot:XP_018289053.1 hypothetical protein PHYBLDRAFT_171074 [Phycomyces blakesleeanus NRRL 1555(-)]